MRSSVQARAMLVEVFEDASLTVLRDAMNTWLAGRQEEQVLEVRIYPGGAGFIGWIAYSS